MNRKRTECIKKKNELYAQQIEKRKLMRKKAIHCGIDKNKEKKKRNKRREKNGIIIIKNKRIKQMMCLKYVVYSRDEFKVSLIRTQMSKMIKS